MTTEGYERKGEAEKLRQAVRQALQWVDLDFLAGRLTKNAAPERRKVLKAAIRK